MACKVLLTGANGQLGSFLASKLAAHYQLVCTTRQELDMSQPDGIIAAVQQIAPTIIINAAAYTAVDQAETDTETAFVVNCTAVQALAEAAAALNAVLIHISTDYVFAGDKAEPYFENDPVGPRSVYGQTKLAGEQAVLASGAKAILLRTSWVFSEVGQNFVKTIAGLAKRLPKLEVVADQNGGPTYAGDLADLICVMVRQVQQENFTGWGVYHFGGFPYVSWHGFATAICAAVNQSVVVEPVSSDKFPRPAPRPANSRLDCSKVQQVFGVAPSDWQQALSHVIAKLPN